MSEDINIFVQLKSEHDELKTLMTQISKARSHKRNDLLSEFKEKLIPHARAEEKTLYSILSGSGVPKELNDLINEAYVEHETADHLLSEVEETSDDELWSARFAVLKENVEHHIQEEENKFFPSAQKYVSGVLEEEMLSAYQKEYERFQKFLPTQHQIKAKVVSSLLKETAL